MLTVQQLAKRTFSTLRLRPVLALPVLMADLIGFAAMHLQHALHQPLFELLLNRNHSVLSTRHTEFVLTSQNATQAALLTAPLLWGCYFLNIFLYAAALIVVAKLMNEYEDGGTPELSTLRSFLARDRRPLFRFSGLAFLSLVAQLPFGYAIFWLAAKWPSFTALQGRNIGYAAAYIVESVAVLFLARPVLNLLRERQPAKKSVQVVRMFGLIALFAQFALSFGMEHLLPLSFFQQMTVLGLLSREAFTSAVNALPFIPLFIGFSIIARISEDRREA